MSEKSQAGRAQKYQKPLEPVFSDLKQRVAQQKSGPTSLAASWPEAALKTVFHVHTNYSDDGNFSPEQLVAESLERGVGCLTVTDHDCIEGARKVARLAPASLKVIIGEEVSTAQGHLIGLFLKEEIAPGQSAIATAKQIKAQGGLVVVPHPFNTAFGCSLKDAVYDLVGYIDAVEIFNAQNVSPFPNRKAAAFAREYGYPALVGGDVHHRGYLDSTYQWLPNFDGPRAFIESIQHAHYVARRHPLPYFFKAANVVVRGLCGLGNARGYGENCSKDRRQLEATTVSA